MAKLVVIKTIFQFKRGAAQAWTDKNPILFAGEPGYELDTGLLKIGNGATAWNDLPYYNGQFTISPDGESLQINDDGQITLYGYSEAKVGQFPIKNAEGGLDWVDSCFKEPVYLYGGSATEVLV